MERMGVLSTNRLDWPVIQDLILASRAEVEKNEMDMLEWNFTVTGAERNLSAFRTQLKEKTPQTICMGIQPFSRLQFVLTCSEELLDEIGQKFQVDIKVGHTSENGQHISIEDKKEVLEKIQSFLAEKEITASIF